MPELLKQLDYDVTIVGTGLTSSILAASLSTAGRSVLHLDPQPFYGSTSATLTVKEWDAIINDEGTSTDFKKNKGTESEDDEDIVRLVREEYGEDAKFVAIETNCFKEAVFPYGVRRVSPTSKDDKFEAKKKDILLDLEPRGLYAAGKMVSLLQRTNVGHYVDFKALEGIYLDFGKDGGIQRVPASRSDVFQTKFVTMVEKRLLMRFIKSAVDENGGEDGDDCGSFEEAMTRAGLTEKLKTIIRDSIAFTGGKGDVSTKKGKEAIKLYQKSLLRFGTPTPFLWTNYGSGDLSQAFCRLSAVNGGVYVLGRGVKGLVLQNGTQIGVVTSKNEFIRTSSLYLEAPLVRKVRYGDEDRVWRIAAIIDRRIIPNKGKIMIVLPRGTAGNKTSTVHLRQFDHSLMVCPQGTFTLYGETIDRNGSEDDLVSALSHYVKLEESPRDRVEGLPGILWAVIYAVSRRCAHPFSFGSDGAHCVENIIPDSTSICATNEAERCFLLNNANKGYRFFRPRDEIFHVNNSR